MKIILAKKFPVTFNDKKYFVKICKNEYQKNLDKCTTIIYKKIGFMCIKLSEETCSYSTNKEENTDFIYFANETIKRYLARKEYEQANRIVFEENFTGNCNELVFDNTDEDEDDKKTKE